MATRTPTPAPTRKQLEAAIEDAIDLLNALDGDTDLEPSLGALNCIGAFVSPCSNPTLYGTYDQTNWAGGGGDDCEE